MDPLLIRIIDHPLCATVPVPGSKSLTNRALLISALAIGQTTLKNALFSDDSKYFSGALQSLGFDIYSNASNSEIVVNGRAGKIPANSGHLFIGNAGTAARFLTAFLTLGNGEFILDGDARMRERPLGDLVTALGQLGARVEPANSNIGPGEADICPPVKIIASGLPGGKTFIKGDISSQYLSALLMVAPYAQSGVVIEVTSELNSKPYVDMTIQVMSDFGVEIRRDKYQKFSIHPARYHSIANYAIEPDASAASYFFAAPAILGGSVRIDNLTRNSRQGDLGFVDVLQKMGCSVQRDPLFTQVSGPGNYGELSGVEVNMSDIPDTAQTLAVIAPFASSPTHIHGIASARVKESDRVHATRVELERLGVKVEEYPDGLKIFPCDKFQPASIKTYNDHRMAMAFALIGLRIPGIIIEDPDCVSKTFPEYFNVLEQLR
jgi:3-phosphoshikimate 1-carboxyvinyltransferase